MIFSKVDAQDIFESTRVRKSKNAIVQVIADATATAISFSVEGSLNNENWDEIGTYSFSASDLTSKSATVILADKAMSYMRVNFTTLTGITSSQITVLGKDS